MRIFLIFFISLFLSACTNLPEGITPVSDFEINKYLGKWYEIARLDHSFERGLDKVSAEYSLREDGGIKVVNKGYSNRDKDWSEAEGKAYFVKSKDEGLLKVSFFGPFYGSYIIFELDKENYQYSFVAGNSRSYLWLLSRTPTVSQDIIDKFVIRSKELGFEIEKLIYVNQSR
ncbi:MAG: lipocalin [Legionellales bacterium]|nr:lipocalin [Legionellales bacterium]